MIEISKELLSEVLGEEIEHIYDKSDMGENYICYMPKVGRNVDINIYELAHKKCKEWALNQEYYFNVYSFNFSENTEQEHRIRLLKGNEVVYYGNDSCSETEVEAIIKSCEWIFRQ